jgi:PAS domain S-box-containing protein
MAAAACLTLALVHLLVWFNHRAARASLLFASVAAGIAAYAAVEMWMMRTATAGDFALALRWAHVPTWIIVVSMVGFVLTYLRAGRPWLAWAVFSLRSLALLLNFLSGANLNYREVTGLQSIPFLGESVSIPIGVPNPLMLVGQASLVLFWIFVTDAAIAVRRRGDGRQALVVGGSMVFFTMTAVAESLLVFWGIVPWPLTASLCFLPVVAAMGFELSRGLLRAVQLSDELREGEKRMELASAAAKLGIWTRDLVRNDIWATAQWRDLFGFAPAERLDFDRYLQRLHPDDRESVRQTLVDAIRTVDHYEIEYRVVLPEGRIRWIASRGRAEYGVDGQLVAVRGVALDITERKQAEEKFRLVVESSPNGIVLVDDQGRITLVNAAMEKLFGYARKEFSGQAVERLLPEGLRGAHPAQRAGYHAAPSARAMGAGRELFARRKDGSVFPVEIGLSPIQTAEGLLVVAVIVDITARRVVEAEAARQRNELSHIARVSVMGQLAASLAHELNQPLGAILRNAEAAELLLLHAMPDLEELRAILEDIRRDDLRAGAVISRMRAFLQRHDAERQPVYLNQMIAEVLSLVRADADARKVRLHFEPTAAFPPVSGDRVQLQQVVLNLLLNAMDALHDSAPENRRVTVGVQPTGGLIEISVSDTGSGIPPDKLASLFEPFFTTKPKGMGMGLSISRSIVEAHGGRLLGGNNAAGGATFRFTLPVSAT